LRRLRSAFDEFDSHHHGKLNKIEFRKIICGQRLFPGASEELLDTLFNAFDIDNSQHVSFYELASALAVLSKAAPEEKLQYMFEIFDHTGSGELDPSDVQSIVKQMKIVTDALGRDTSKLEPFVRFLLDDGDVDGNGKITKMEWLQAARKANGILDLLQFNYNPTMASPEDTPPGTPRTDKEKKRTKRRKKKKENEKLKEAEKLKKEEQKRIKKRVKEMIKEEKQYEAKPGELKKQYEVKEKKEKGLFKKKK